MCEQNLVQRLELFGSATTDRFNPVTSDFDFLVTFKAMPLNLRSDTFFGLLFALEDLLHRKIDLIEIDAIRNEYFKQSIQCAPRQLLYESRSTETVA
jgi:predicted nucleotidyltransferase